MRIEDVYENPLDIVKFFQDGLDEEWFMFLLDSANDFYSEHGVSPIIEQIKFKAFAVDYYFMIEVMIDFIKSKVDEDLYEELETRIRNNFVEGDGGLKNNGDFLIGILKYLGYIFPANSRNFFYTQIAYFNADKTLGFIHCGVLLNGYKLKEEKWEDYAKMLEGIGDKRRYDFVGMGTSKLKDFILECSENEVKLLSWKKR